MPQQDRKIWMLRLLKRPLVVAVLACALGIAVGMPVGWATFRAQGATPASLRPDLQADYLRMAIQSLQVNLDPNLAVRRWDALGPQAEPLLEEVMRSPGNLDSKVVTAYSQLIHAIKGAGGGRTVPSNAGTWTAARAIGLLMVLAGMAMGIAAVRQWRRFQPGEAAAEGSAVRPGRGTPPEEIKALLAGAASLFTSFSTSSAWRVVRYLIGRVVMILVTIFAGTFITVVLANQGGQIDKAVQNEVDAEMDRAYPGWRWQTEMREDIRQAQIRFEQASGLDMPYWPRQVAWTIRALRLDWEAPVKITAAPGSNYPSQQVMDIILTDLPHTLLLVGTSFLLLFLIGIPLSLYLYRHQGSRLDRFFTLLAPISSIPSWVLSVILVLIFAAQLHILPIGGMYDTVSAETNWGRMLMVGRHMILPVLAILLSLLFQCAYTWRSFFLLYAEEDYVELAHAKGLPNSIIERRYVLRPTLPYILTNFTLLLIGFWQMTIALEKILNWPGIGRLYLTTLPNFFGERFYPGVMPVTLGIVVLFAYILGFTVLILEVAYALVDPQIRLGNEGPTVQEPRAPGRWTWPWARRAKEGRDRHAGKGALPAPQGGAFDFAATITAWVRALGRWLEELKPVARELRRSPSAMFGLSVIAILVISSVYVVTVYPYNKLADVWGMKVLTGKIYVPRLASPAWVNFFRKDKLPPSIIVDSSDPSVAKTSTPDVNGIGTVSLTYTINYPYREFPQNILVYFDSTYAVKQPFAQLTWITPDGREIEVGRTGASPADYFDVSERMNTQRILAENPPWQKWFVRLGNYPTPAVDLLFADPSKDQPSVIPGTYRLRIDGVTFEPGSTVEAQFVLLGQVYGVAGTDQMRRDLLVPLLWGMPFALIFGLLGAFVTTFLSMTLAAMAAWYGGWLDSLIQRLVEANMVLPIIAMAVLIYAYFNASIWTLLAIIVLLNVFASPTKSFRAAFLQVRNAPYIEAARAYGASNGRIILQYLVPRILPMFIPQLVSLIPSYVFLEATLGIFNVRSDYPTWGRTIYDALRYGSNYGSSYWVLEPLSLLLLTGLAFAMVGFALERVLNPRTLGKA